jgi:ligand-binding sensor domain-containing protein
MTFFALVINFLGKDWIIPGHGLFWPSFGKDLIELLGKSNLKEKIIAYVKDEGSNLNTMTRAFKLL